MTFVTMPGKHSNLYAAKASFVFHLQWTLRSRPPREGRLRRKFPETILSRGPWLASGLCCPAGSMLTMTSSAPLTSTRQLMDSLSSPPTQLGGKREVPN